MARLNNLDFELRAAPTERLRVRSSTPFIAQDRRSLVASLGKKGRAIVGENEEASTWIEAEQFTNRAGLQRDSVSLARCEAGILSGWPGGLSTEPLFDDSVRTMLQETGQNSLISVVVVNWNGERFLPDCLESLERQTWPFKEFIVVDNGSSDRSVAMLCDWSSGRKDTQVIRLRENTGFTRANNLAFERAKGEWIALLNNDATAEPDWLENLFKCGDRNRRIGMIASKILLADPPGVIDKAGHLIYRDGQNRGRGAMEPDRGQYDQETEILWPDACAALYHRDLLEETGGFDETFFAYGDDADLGMRARLLGWKGWLAPKAVVYHRHSATAGAYSPLKVMLVERNRILLALKNFPLPILLQNPYWSLRRYFWHAYAAWSHTGSAGRFASENGGWRLLVSLAWSYASTARLLPHALHQRRTIQKTRRLKTAEIAALLKRYEIDVRELALRD